MTCGVGVGVNLDCSVVVPFRLMCLGATSTSKTKVPGSNPTSDTLVFSSVFILPSLDLLPRTTVKLN